MTAFEELIAALRRRPANEKLMRTLDALRVLNGLPGDGRKSRVRLPYSSDPRVFEDQWK